MDWHQIRSDNDLQIRGGELSVVLMEERRSPAGYDDILVSRGCSSQLTLLCNTICCTKSTSLPVVHHDHTLIENVNLVDRPAPSSQQQQDSGDELLIVVTQERRYGPRWVRDNDDEDDNAVKGVGMAYGYPASLAATRRCLQFVSNVSLHVTADN